LTIGGDQARRAYLTQMDAKVAHPWERGATEFQKADIMQWVRDNRAEIISKIMIMARAWVVAGRPPGGHTAVLGGFKEFTDAIGGILSYAGVDLFLDNMNVLYETVDTESDEWDQFFEGWYKLFKNTPKTTAQIMIELTDKDRVSDMKDATPGDISEKISYLGTGDAVKIGKVLRKQVGVETKNGYKLTMQMDDHKKTQKWILKKKDGQTEW
jgi:hypothetical protein